MARICVLTHMAQKHTTTSADKPGMPQPAPFSLTAEGEPDHLRLISDQWEDFPIGSPLSGDRYVMHIGQTDDLCDTVLPTGWSLIEQGRMLTAAYAPKGKAHFLIRYAPDSNEVTVCVKFAIKSFIRTGSMFGTLIALHHRCVGLHGVTVACGDETVILSAPSGTGKTTLSRILEEHGEARVINGDFALLSVTEDGVIFEPTPFCGSSGICLNERRRVDRIVFLSQAKENRWRELSGREALAALYGNVFIPTFDPHLCQAVEAQIVEIAARVKISGYGFAPEPAAADTFFDSI